MEVGPVCSMPPHSCGLLLQGDAEDLPFAPDSFDRYMSAGSIEYWPEPQRGICEVGEAGPGSAAQHSAFGLGVATSSQPLR